MSSMTTRSTRSKTGVIAPVETKGPLMKDKNFFDLKKEGYSYFTTPKNFFNGREQHAIVDLLIGEMCTGTFIGNWNHSRNVGSSYSYVLGKRIKDPNAKQVYVDMYDISSKPKEFGLEDQALYK